MGPDQTDLRHRVDLDSVHHAGQPGVPSLTTVLNTPGKTNNINQGNTVVPGFRVLGFSALPGFRALNAGDGAWSVHKTLFGFKAPILGSWLLGSRLAFEFLLEFEGILLDFGVFIFA